MKLEMLSLCKDYKKKCALDHFSLGINEGVYGLLGPNGAGKTTLINILVGLVSADKGQVLFNGINTNNAAIAFVERIGYLPQYQALYNDFTALEFLLYMCAIKGTKKAERKDYVASLLQKVHLFDVANKKILELSGGMRQRLGIAQAIIGEPDIIIFDEPTAGLDPKERISFRNLISELGTTHIVILATHIVTDVEYIAKEIIMIKHGRLALKGSTPELIESMVDKVWEVSIDAKDALNIMNNFMVSNMVCRGEKYIARIVAEKKPMESALLAMPTLEDVYLYIFRGS